MRMVNLNLLKVLLAGNHQITLQEAFGSVLVLSSFRSQRDYDYYPCEIAQRLSQWPNLLLSPNLAL